VSDKSGIAWTNATWNPVTGCSKVSPGCAHCYAERLSLRFGRSFDVTLHPDRLDIPLHWRKPRRVFVNSMSDLFHEWVPEEFIHRVWVVMESAASHTFQVLTKRPERMRDILTGCLSDRMPPNVWLGASIENDRFVGRADALRETPASVRFISAEPLLGPLPSLDLTGIDWLVIGGESGPGWRPMALDWARHLVERADVAGCAVFVKQDSGSRPGKQGRLPDDLWARKEYPS
jgi:protein gp37